MSLVLHRRERESIFFNSGKIDSKLTFVKIVNSSMVRMSFDKRFFNIKTNCWTRLADGIEIRWFWKSNNRISIQIDADDEILIMREELK